MRQLLHSTAVWVTIVHKLQLNNSYHFYHSTLCNNWAPFIAWTLLCEKLITITLSVLLQKKNLEWKFDLLNFIAINFAILLNKKFKVQGDEIKKNWKETEVKQIQSLKPLRCGWTIKNKRLNLAFHLLMWTFRSQRKKTTEGKKINTFVSRYGILKIIVTVVKSRRVKENVKHTTKSKERMESTTEKTTTELNIKKVGDFKSLPLRNSQVFS